MKDAPIVERVEIDWPVIVDTMDTFVSKRQVTKGSRVVDEYYAEERDSRDNFKNYKVSDFCIENLQATGAIEDLRTVQYYDGDIDGVLGQFDAICDNDNKNIEE